LSDISEQLRKVLDLEKSKGYNNTAVFGGLDKFLERWTDKFKGDLPSPSYAYLSVNDREEWVERIQKQLNLSPKWTNPFSVSR
jgi:uncharacterized protein Usg